MVPGSPRRGKIRSMLWSCASEAQVAHRIGGEGDVVAVLVGGASGGLHADAGGDARQHDLRDTAAAQLDVEAGAVESTQVAFGDGDVAGAAGQFGDDYVPALGQAATPAGGLGAARDGVAPVRGERDPDQHHGQVAGTEGVGEFGRTGDDLGAGVRLGGRADDAGLEVDHDEGGARIECGDGHGSGPSERASAFGFGEWSRGSVARSGADPAGTRGAGSCRPAAPVRWAQSAASAADAGAVPRKLKVCGSPAAEAIRAGSAAVPTAQSCRPRDVATQE